MERIADQIDALCSSAHEELLLTAPFIKYAVLVRLFSRTQSSVYVQVVTRWLPQDIRAGVSDLEVWDAVRERARTRLWLRQDLHAKYYRADDHCLVGSANLTGAALGLSAAPNLELLVPVRPNSAGLEDFEERLLAGAVAVDDDLVNLTRTAVDQLPKLSVVEESIQISPAEQTSPTTWVPVLRQPEDLFVAYKGQCDALSGVAQRGAVSDLSMLRVPPGLDERAFRSVVAVTLLRMPVVAAVDRFIIEPRRFGEVRDLLTHLLQSSDAANHEWQVLFRWMMYFLGDRFEYRRPHHSEIIARRSALPPRD
jgi:hypothetical protein